MNIFYMTTAYYQWHELILNDISILQVVVLVFFIGGSIFLYFLAILCLHPENEKIRTNIVLMSGHRLRLWPDIRITLSDGVF